MRYRELRKIDNLLIIGHRNPDMDSIISSSLLKNIFLSKKIKCDYAIFETDIIQKNTKVMLDDCMEYKPFMLKENEIKNYKYFIVDHNDLIQSIKDPTLVVGCIDHHFDTNDIYKPLIMNYTSTSLCIYKMFKSTYKFNEEEKKQIFFASLSDSKFGLSSRYQKKDAKLINKLGYSNDYKEYFKKYFIPTDISLEDSFSKSSLKKYDFYGYKFQSTIIEALDTKRIDEYKEFINNKNDNFLGIWYDYNENKTYCFLKYRNKLIEFSYNYNASRSKKIIKDVLLYINKI